MRIALFVAAFGLLATPAAAEPALKIIPRSPEEAARIATVTTPTTDFSKAEPFEERSAGAATRFGRPTRDAFSAISANASFERELTFKLGNGLFRRDWVAAPASTIASDGLGPLFNARSCQGCHLKDGRGHPPEGPDDARVSMFLRVSVPVAPIDPAQRLGDYLFATEPEPVYGLQIQDLALPGHAPEARMEIAYAEETVTLADGLVVSLRRPSYSVSGLGYGPMRADALLSPRVAPQMIGLGLLEAIPEGDILEREDPGDADGDGISGRANRTADGALGRFGLKAGAPSVRAQSAGAFSGDMGLSTSLAPDGHGECTPAQAACRGAVHGGDPAHGGLEVADPALDLVTFYARNLAVPARRDVGDPQVLEGKRVFYESGCAGCHAPKFVTHRLADQPEQSFQLIWPYTDLLLHDMGEGLADGRPEGLATGREWRTAPLWGLGLTDAVSGHTYLLHDGRARGPLEAILWHGGEAQAARDRVVAMPTADREALLRFLGSL